MVVAQCNLMNGPNAGKGRHQDLKQFRNDLRSALGARFASFLGEGEVEGGSGGGFRYKVGVQGRKETSDWSGTITSSPAPRVISAAGDVHPGG